MFSSASIIQQLFLTEMNLIRLIRQHIQSINVKRSRLKQTDIHNLSRQNCHFHSPTLISCCVYSNLFISYLLRSDHFLTFINFLFDLVDMTPFSSTCALSHFISENCISTTFCFSEVSLIPMELSFIRCKN